MIKPLKTTCLEVFYGINDSLVGELVRSPLFLITRAVMSSCSQLLSERS